LEDTLLRFTSAKRCDETRRKAIEVLWSDTDVRRGGETATVGESTAVAE
jgi:hypothetical protein